MVVGAVIPVKIGVDGCRKLEKGIQMATEVLGVHVRSRRLPTNPSDAITATSGFGAV